ncbi:MAG: hypothetical protein AAF801_14595 [Pseudomonadota bacterium]
MRLLLPLCGVLLTLFAAGVLFVVKAGIDDYVSANSLVAKQIDMPDGWSVRPYQASDGAWITQTHDDPSSAVGTTAQILAGFAIPTGGLDEGTVKTVWRGDEMIALRIQPVPHVPQRVSLMERFGRVSDDDADDPNAIFATVAGVPLVVHPRFAQVDGADTPIPVNYRYFTMTLGDQKIDEALELAFLTNSSDAALVAVVDGLDMDALNARLPTPDPRVMISAGVLTRDPLPLADTPPPPTPAFRAMQLLASGTVFDAPWQDALTQIRNGNITSWESLQARYPRLDTLPYALLEVLDDGSQTNTARYYATILSNSGRAWTGHEFHVLSTIAQIGSTQADIAEYLAGEYDVAPEVLALAKRLPQSTDATPLETKVVQSGTLPAVGLRNAGTCVMENGVRRCVVDSN